MNPFKTEEGKSYFYLRDVQDYGCPSYYGFTNFYVIDADPVYVYTNYNENPGYSLKKRRAPHLYDRSARFHVIVCQLLGYKLSVAKSVMRSEKWRAISSEISNITDNYWNEARKILKNHNYSKYYNCIPSIVREYCYFKEKIVYTEKDYRNIMTMFQRFQHSFKTNKCGRKYFPNLRYIALRIMQIHKIPLQFPIPLLITKTKIKLLNTIFKSLVSGQQSGVEDLPISGN